MPKIGSTRPEQDIYVDQVCGHFQVQAIFDIKEKNPLDRKTPLKSIILFCKVHTYVYSRNL